MGFLPYCGCVNTTVCMHHLDANQTHGEKARWELHENVTYCFEQILETITNKTAVVWPPTSHLKKHQCDTNKTQTEKPGQTHQRRFL